MRSTHLSILVCACLVFALAIDVVFAAKIIGRYTTRNIVTLDQSFKKGTRLEVFIGSKKIGLIESLGGDKAKIIYGKKTVDIGAIALVKRSRDGTWRFTYTALNFVEIETNQKYISLTSMTPFTPSSGGYRIRFKMDYLKSGGSSVGGGLYLGYARLGSYLSGIEIGAIAIFAIETIPEILELHLTGSAGYLLSASERKWARPNGNYDDNIGRNSGNANPFAALPIEIGGGLDWRISNITSIFVYGLYTSIVSEDWKDTETKSTIIKKEWLEYNAKNLAGFAIEIGLRLNVVFK